MSNTSAQTLSLERKSRMYEAREAIINRLAPTLQSEIDLDKFLQAIVSELGQMMDVDRCDVIQLAGSGELRISHEWRANTAVPSSLGPTLPVGLRPLVGRFDLTRAVCIGDTAAPRPVSK